MKRAFTLAEFMITLTIISVIAAIVTPSILDTIPNKKAYLYKSAFNIVETTVNELTADTTLYSTGDFTNTTTPSFFCSNFANKVNTIAAASCTDAGSSTSPNFITTNGMKWWGFYNTFADSPLIYVDVDGDNGSGVEGSDILRIQISSTGKVSPNPNAYSGSYIEQSYLKKIKY